MHFRAFRMGTGHWIWLENIWPPTVEHIRKFCYTYHKTRLVQPKYWLPTAFLRIKSHKLGLISSVILDIQVRCLHHEMLPALWYKICVFMMPAMFGKYIEKKKIQIYHIIPQPPSLRPPLEVVVIAAVLQISSKTSWTNSPVTAAHSIYLSHLISCATLYASCG